MSMGAVVDPHDKLRARDVNRVVARGEQAPRPAHDHGTVSKAPPPPRSTPLPVPIVTPIQTLPSTLLLPLPPQRLSQIRALVYPFETWKVEDEETGKQLQMMCGYRGISKHAIFSFGV
ncbi:hypothetical protein RJ639_006435 [Escallonia herrerae]|uniref:Uncharacterized protein n=1 Tax=Escallonia herrerae TaxID=1293975 RepID=A0AA88VZ15_9ASTE|nr:hypothetical protein RJ639_006435 [Escallonia herrerae]